MRADTWGFFAKNIQKSRDARFVIEVAFDSANSVLRYFGSHDDCDYPSSVTVYDGIVSDFSSTSQKLDPITGNSSIGDISFTLIDSGSDVTELLAAQLAAGRSLRKNRVRVYAGFKGLLWADYTLLTTQFIDKAVSYKDGEYTIECSDIQRDARQKIFKPYTTNLTSALAKADTTINCVSTTNFTRVYHDAGYSDSPSSTVGYLKLYKSNDEYEIVRYTGTTSTTFTGVTRALFGTKALDITVDTGLSNDRRPKIEEFIYLEGPAPKIIYALRTGTLYNDAATLPDHWNVGASTDYVRLADFTGYGTDWWDTTDPTKGFRVRFEGLKETDGKQFIERELQLLLGAFGPIYSDGAVGLKKMAQVISNAGAVADLTAANIVSYSDLTHNYARLHNDIEISWNYDNFSEKFTRINRFLDSDSQSIYGTSDKYQIEFRGLIGDIHTTAMLLNQFAAIRDRYAGPPLELQLEVLPSLNTIEVGDVVRVRLDQVRDYTGDVDGIDRTFEVQSVSINWISGTVTLNLFGSSKLAQWVPLDTTGGSFIAAGYYTGTGTALTSALTISSNQVTANGSLTGHDTATNASAIYYHNNDLTINSGVTVTGTKNLFLKIKGYLTINGTLTLAAGGPAGGASTVTLGSTPTWNGSEGTVGAIGVTNSQGGIVIDTKPTNNGFITYNVGTASPFLGEQSGAVSTPPTVNVSYDGSTLSGLPTDLRGTGGPGGGAIIQKTSGTATTATAGGAGGAGGGGLMILCRGLAFGASGQIVLSGGAGSAGTSVLSGSFVSGAGGGGSPGWLCVLIDGNSITYPDITSSTVVQAYGDSPASANYLEQTEQIPLPVGTPKGLSSNCYYSSIYTNAERYSPPDASGLWHRVVYVNDTQTATADPRLIASVPTSVGTSTATNTPQTPAQNLATITVTVTPPSDGNYLYSNIYYRVTGTTPWQLAGPALNSRTIVAAMDGTGYDIEARSVSRLGGESPTGARTTVTVGSGTGGVTLASGNYLRTNANVGDGSASGYGVSFNVDGLKGYKASSSTPTFTLDASDGSFTFGQTSTGKYLDFDASSGDITLGRDTKLLGTDAYSNDGIYYRTLFDSLDRYFTSYTNGNVTLANEVLEVTTGNTTPSNAKAYLRIKNALSVPSWSKTRRFKAKISLPSFSVGSGDGTIWLLVGNETNNAFGFKFTANGTNRNMYGVAINSGTETATFLQTFSTSSYYVVEAVFTTSTNVVAYVDGTALATITTNLPSGTGNDVQQIFYAYGVNSSAVQHQINVYEYIFIQDP